MCRHEEKHKIWNRVEDYETAEEQDGRQIRLPFVQSRKTRVPVLVCVPDGDKEDDTQ